MPFIRTHIYAMAALFIGVAVGAIVQLTTGSVGLTCAAASLSALIAGLLALPLDSLITRAALNRYAHREAAFRQEALAQGWVLQDLLALKYNLRGHLLHHPGLTTDELFLRYGDATKPHLTADNFEKTLTHLGFYSRYRFGKRADGKWYALRDAPELESASRAYARHLAARTPVEA